MIEATPDVKIETSSSIPSIYDYFPKLLKTLKKMKYQGGSLEEWLEWTEEHFKSEIDAIISEEWALLKTFNDGIICGHTICMLYSLLHDSYRFALLSKTDQNLSLWAALFHDLAKRGYPLIEGRDPIHPFRSAIVALKIMRRLGWWSPVSEQSFQACCDLIYNAFLVVKSARDGYEYEVHDNSKLMHIFDKAEQAGLKVNSEVDIIFRIVLLHQSFTVLKKYPSFAPIQDLSVIRRAIPNSHYFNLHCIMMRHDSLSYLISVPTKAKRYGDQIQYRLDKMWKAVQKSKQ